MNNLNKYPDSFIHANKQAAIDAIIYHYQWPDKYCRIGEWTGIGSEGEFIRRQFPNAGIIVVQCSYNELNAKGNIVSRVMTAHAPYHKD